MVVRAGETSSVVGLVTRADLLTHVVTEEAVTGTDGNETHADDEGINLRREHILLLSLGGGSEKHGSAHF